MEDPSRAPKVARAELVRQLGLYALTSLVAGVLGALLTSSADGFNFGSERALWVTVLLFLLVLTMVCEGVYHLSRRLTHCRVTVNVAESEREREQAAAFALCSKIARRATKSIHVIGPHFPMGTDSSAPPETKGHSNFLESIEYAVQARLKSASSGGTSLVYKRVIQLGSDAVRGAVDDKTLRSTAIGDPAMARHIESMLTLARQTFASIDIRVREFIPSIPSILVIDERWIFFSLPSYLTVAPGVQAQSPELRYSPSLDYDFVLNIEDSEGAVARKFISLIDQFAMSGTIVNDLDVGR